MAVRNFLAGLIQIAQFALFAFATDFHELFNEKEFKSLRRSSLQRLFGDRPQLGGQGSVKFLENDKFGKVAVKSTPPSRKTLALNELAALQKIAAAKVPNVAQLKGAFHDQNGNYVILTEYAGARTLHQALDADQPRFSMCAIRANIRRLCETFAALKALKLVHRDLKPENIVLNERGDFVVIDFGMAVDYLQPVGMQGTAGFVPPEISLGISEEYFFMTKVTVPATYAIDAWGIGVIAYCMLEHWRMGPFIEESDQSRTLRSAFTKKQPKNLDLYTVLIGRYGYLEAALEKMRCDDPEARDFVRRMMARKPEERMDAEQALDHPWLASLNPPDPPAMPTPPPPVALRASRRAGSIRHSSTNVRSRIKLRQS